MRIRPIKFGLWTLGVCCYASAAALLLWAWLGSYETDLPARDRRTLLAAGTAARTRDATSPRDFQSVASAHLQSGDAPARTLATSPDATFNAPSSEIQLIGTILEPNHSFAIFATTKSIQLKRVGETLDDGDTEVVAIDREQVVVRQQGTEVTLALLKTLRRVPNTVHMPDAFTGNAGIADGLEPPPSVDLKPEGN